MKLYCDITRQRFVQSFRLTAEITIIWTQNDDPEIQVYLLVPSPGGGRWPYMYDVNSGKAGVIATATLCNPGGTPLTLTEAVELTAIKNGFSGTLHLDTEEIATFLAGRSDRKAFLAIELDGSQAIFYGEVTLRAASTSAASTRIPGVIRATLVTGYTGGGNANLDGQVTVGKPLGTRYEVTVNGFTSFWEVSAGSLPTDTNAGIILTTDGRQLLRTLGF